MQILYAQGCYISDNDTSQFPEALAAVNKADVSVIFIGLNQSVESEGLDRFLRCLENL